MKKDKIMKRGDFDWRMDQNGLSITKWMDNKAVHFISNMHNPHISENTSRKNKDGSEIIIGGNLVNKDYNKHMGYVDKADMLKSLYGLDRKSKKWWHRIAFHFLDVSLVNAFVLFKNIRSVKVSLKIFKLNVIHGLVGATAFRQPKNKKRSSGTFVGPVVDVKRHKATIAPSIRFDGSDHLPTMTENWRRCNFCSTKKQPHRTKWQCTICKVPLCNNKNQCFKTFHTK